VKIVQIAATETISTDGNPAGTLYALTDDGSIWMMLDPWEDDAEWRPLRKPGDDE